ncbi:MAG: hypothetical protein EHM61_23360 [Acidobacteria bacterium]|nr:MAG: hypothetical protein EHM61_23360 [Acidobacteriota bacterium]
MQIKDGFQPSVNRLILPLCCLMMTACCFAQTHSYYITGVVLVNEKRPGVHAPEIQVQLTTERRGEGIRSVVTESGDYKFGGLESGTYLITASAPGYRTVTTRIEINNVGQVRGVTTLDLVSETPLPTVSHDGEVISQNALKAPREARRQVERAEKALETGRTAEAEEAIGKALQAYPDYGVALFLRGRLFQTRRRSRQAREEYAKALVKDPDLYRAYPPLCEIERAGADYQALKESAETWKQMQPLIATPYYYLAVALYELGDYGPALQEAMRARGLPHEAVPHLSLVLANCHLKLRDPRAASIHLLEFLEQHPDDPLAPQARETLEQLRKLGGS